MKDDLWFEERLVSTTPTAQEVAQGLKNICGEPIYRTPVQETHSLMDLYKAPDKGQQLERFVWEKAQGVLRVHVPRWRPLTAQEAGTLPTGLGDVQAGSIGQGDLYLVRLGLEFDVLPEGRKGNWSYSAAWCRAYLFSPGSGVKPRVLTVYPQRLYHGERRTVKVEVGLGVKVEPVEVEVAKIGTDLQLGCVMPVAMGFLGEEERAPYWELRRKDRPILGIYHFWMIVEQPPGCPLVRLAALGEGELQTRHFNIPVGPKERDWENRKSVVLTRAE